MPILVYLRRPNISRFIGWALVRAVTYIGLYSAWYEEGSVLTLSDMDR